MNNLKRVLSLGMAGTMLAGMMTAGAADTSDFTDGKEITHKDAVNTMISLNIINGRDDGSYAPKETVTRAQMAKMITIALNGGRDFTAATKANPTFSDIKGHWAESYIEYCAALGIINGQGDGTFAPDATVTGSQAAKMVLTALGYNAENAGMTGADWEINTNVLAGQKNLFAELETLNPTLPLSRDDAAQLIFNGVKATMVEYTYNAQTVNGTLTMVPQVKEKTHFVGGTETKTTILTEKYNLVSAYAYISDFSYDENKDEYTYSFKTDSTFGDSIDTTVALSAKTLKSSNDYTELFGEKVNVLYKNNTEKTVYGIFESESTVLTTVYTGELPTIKGADTSVKINGVSYSLDKKASATNYYNMGDIATTGKLDTLSGLAQVKFIDNNDNGKADVVVVTPLTVAKVSYVGKNSLTINAATIGTQDLDDVVVYDGVAKNDQVILTAAANAKQGKLTIEKAEIKNGTITGTKGTNKYLVDGSWLTDTTSATLKTNDTIEYVALGNEIYYVDVTSGAKSVDDILVVVGTLYTAKNNISGAKAEAKVLFADGSKATVNLVDASGNTLSGTAGGAVTGINCGDLYTYEVNNDDEYTLTAVSGTNLVGFDAYSSTAPNGTTNVETVGGWKVADDAIVFTYDSSANNGKVYTGKELKAQAKSNYTAGAALMEKVNGFQYAQVIVVSGAASFSGIVDGDNYGYLTADTYMTKVDGTNYKVYTIWNGSETIKVREETSSSTAVTAGTVVTYDVVDTETIKNVKTITTKVVAVTGWDDKNIAFNDSSSTTYKVTDDTVILYVDSADKTGAEGAIRHADEPMDNTFISNVAYFDVNTTDYVELIVVDVNNKWDGVANKWDTTGSSDNTLADLKKNGQDGVYSVDTLPSDVTDAGSTASNVIFIKFTGDASTYTVNFFKNDSKVDSASFTVTGNGGHVCYFLKTAITGTSANDVIDFEVVAADGTVALTGTFTR